MRVAIYLRVSSEQQVERFSLSAQERICRAVVDAQEGTVVAVYHDDGASAFNDALEHRPQFKALLDDAGKGLFDAVMVYALDRFARNMAGAQDWLRVLRSNGVELLSATEWFDSSPAGEFTRHLLFAQAEYWGAVHGRRMKDALQEKVRRGGLVGRRPYGYCRGTCRDCVEATGQSCPRYGKEPLGDGRVVVPRPRDADGYRFAVRAFLEGADSFREVADILNGAGYRTQRGGRFAGDSVRRILTSPVYIGMAVLRDRARNAVAYPGLHEPLIDRETWERVQRKSARRREMYRGNRERANIPFPLSGVAACARCGAPLVGGTPSQSRRRRYLCSETKRRGRNACDLPSFHAEACEEAVAALLDGFEFAPDWRERVAERVDQAVPVGPSLDGIEAEEKRLTLLFQEGYVEFAEFKRRWDRLQSRRVQAAPPPMGAVLEVGEFLAAGPGNAWRDFSERHKRRTIRTLLRSVAFDGERSDAPQIVAVEWQPEVDAILHSLSVG